MSKEHREREMPDLAIDPVDLAILILELAAHVDGHVPEIADHRVDLAHVLLHLVLARVVRYLADVAALGPEAVALVHHPLGLVVHHLAVVVALPRALVLLEVRAPKQRHITPGTAIRQFRLSLGFFLLSRATTTLPSLSTPI